MTLTTITPELPRDRWGRPLVTPPDGGKPVPYTRCTKFVDALEDKYNLSKWQQRMVALGLVGRSDLQLAVAAHRDDKGKLNKIVDEAMEEARAGAAATIGTALHSLTEAFDRGEQMPSYPDTYRADLNAYATATKPLKMLPEYIERFMVHDPLRIGGTPDRIVELAGRRYIADLKTGSVDYAIGKIAQQLAVYAHSVTYDHVTGTREPVEGVDQDTAIVIHLPAGTGTCELISVDIAAGWEAVQLSAKVRAWRSRKNLHAPLDAVAVARRARALELIDAADHPDDLNDVYRDHVDVWTDDLTVAGAARKAELTGN